MWPQRPNSCNLQSKEPANRYKQSNQVKLNQLVMEDDKNCQINRRPVKSKKDMQLKKPAKLESSYKEKELKYIYEDKNCQDTMCEYYDSKSQSAMKKCSDKNCQENENIEMRPKKPRSHMKSVTKKTDVWLPKPAIRRLCNDKNCQSIRCYKKY